MNLILRAQVTKQQVSETKNHGDRSGLNKAHPNNKAFTKRKPVSTCISVFHASRLFAKEMGHNISTKSVLLFDHQKAFDLIDHKTLVKKLKQVSIPNSVINRGYRLPFREISKSQTWKRLPF